MLIIKPLQVVRVVRVHLLTLLGAQQLDMVKMYLVLIGLLVVAVDLFPTTSLAERFLVATVATVAVVKVHLVMPLALSLLIQYQQQPIQVAVQVAEALVEIQIQQHQVVLGL
jgi:hypothetical protein